MGYSLYLPEYRSLQGQQVRTYSLEVIKPGSGSYDHSPPSNSGNDIGNLFVSPAPTGSPAVTGTASSATSVYLWWDEVDCIQRNSEITHYRVWYVPVPSAEDSIQRDVPTETYTIAELQPFTNYSIELAAVNSASQVGPNTTIAIQTLQNSRS